MSKLALGIIEAVGLAAAIEAADVATKSANVKLIGYELTKGDGMATVKVEGSVGAVKAAIDAAVASASKVNKVWGRSVIPRPGDGMEMLIYSDETVGLEKHKDQKEHTESEEESENVNDIYIEDEHLEYNKIEYIDGNKESILKAIEEDHENIEENEEMIEKDYEEFEIDEDEDSTLEVDICNLCKDPACPRRKGDLRKMCIHYKEFKKEGRFYK